MRSNADGCSLHVWARSTDVQREFKSSGKTRHDILHHGAHVFHCGRTHFADDRSYSRHDLFFSGGFGQISFDQLDLGGFLIGHLLATAFGELLDRILALLDQRTQHLLGFFVVKWRHLFDLAVLERGLNHAQGREACLVAGFHRSSDVCLDLFGQAHAGDYSCWSRNETQPHSTQRSTERSESTIPAAIYPNPASIRYSCCYSRFQLDPFKCCARIVSSLLDQRRSFPRRKLPWLHSPCTIAPPISARCFSGCSPI